MTAHFKTDKDGNVIGATISRTPPLQLDYSPEAMARLAEGFAKAKKAAERLAAESRKLPLWANRHERRKV